MKLSKYKICFSKLTDQTKGESSFEEEFSYEDGSATWEKILSSKSDYALVIKEGVVLPFDIEDIIEDIIKKNNLRWKDDHWAFIGNYGSEFISSRAFKCLRNMDSRSIPTMTGISRVAQYLDANLLVVNVKKLREVNLETVYPGNYDSVFFNIFLESYKKTLVSLIDSNLYAYIEPRFDKKIFSYKLFENKKESNYWKKNFVNHKFYGVVKSYDLEVNYSYLEKGADNRGDFYEIVRRAVKVSTIEKKLNVQIIIRTQFSRINTISRLLNSIESLHESVSNFNIEVVFAINNIVDSQASIESKLTKARDRYSFDISSHFIEKSSHFPRVAAMTESVLDANDNIFVWYIDDDDFVLPNAFDELSPYLNRESVLIANSVVFDECWDGEQDKAYPCRAKYLKVYDGTKYANVISGDNCIPVCSVIYPVSVLKTIFKKYNLLGDYNEDYTLLLLAIKETDFVMQLPIAIAGISYHGENTVLEKNREHWQKSYVTFMREVVNSGLSRNLFVEHIDCGGVGGAKGGGDVFLKAVRIFKRKGFLSFIKFGFLFLVRGRKYFRDGVESLESK